MCSTFLDFPPQFLPNRLAFFLVRGPHSGLTLFSAEAHRLAGAASCIGPLVAFTIGVGACPRLLRLFAGRSAAGGVARGASPLVHTKTKVEVRVAFKANGRFALVATCHIVVRVLSNAYAAVETYHFCALHTKAEAGMSFRTTRGTLKAIDLATSRISTDKRRIADTICINNNLLASLSSRKIFLSLVTIDLPKRTVHAAGNSATYVILATDKLECVNRTEQLAA